MSSPYPPPPSPAHSRSSSYSEQHPSPLRAPFTYNAYQAPVLQPTYPYFYAEPQSLQYLSSPTSPYADPPATAFPVSCEKTTAEALWPYYVQQQFKAPSYEYPDNTSGNLKGSLLSPPAESARQSWITFLKPCLPVTALFALSNILLTDRTSMTFSLKIVGHVGMACNVGATISGLIMMDILGELPTRFWRSSGYPHQRKTTCVELATRPSDSELLQQSGTDLRWTIAITYFVLAFIAGCTCLAIQIGVKIWAESGSVIACCLCVVCAVIPLFNYLFASFLMGCLNASQ